MNKTYKNYEVLNILNSCRNDSIKSINAKDKNETKFLWILHKNIKLLENIESLYHEAEAGINKHYSSNEYSNETTNDKGETIRQIKPEYLKEYTERMEELLTQDNEISILSCPYNLIENMELSLKMIEGFDFMLTDD